MRPYLFTLWLLPAAILLPLLVLVWASDEPDVDLSPYEYPWCFNIRDIYPDTYPYIYYEDCQLSVEPTRTPTPTPSPTSTPTPEPTPSCDLESKKVQERFRNEIMWGAQDRYFVEDRPGDHEGRSEDYRVNDPCVDELRWFYDFGFAPGYRTLEGVGFDEGYRKAHAKYTSRSADECIKVDAYKSFSAGGDSLDDDGKWCYSPPGKTTPTPTSNPVKRLTLPGDGNTANRWIEVETGHWEIRVEADDGGRIILIMERRLR